MLGVTLDSKLTWKPHITRITRKATTALMQCRQIVGKTWRIKTSRMKWIYTAVKIIKNNLPRFQLMTEDPILHLCLCICV